MERKETLDVKTSYDGERYQISLSGKASVIDSVGLEKSLGDFQTVAETTKEAPTTPDKQSSYWVEALGDGFVVLNIMSARSGLVLSREQLGENLLNDGWKLKGFTGLGNDTVLEKWLKKQK